MGQGVKEVSYLDLQKNHDVDSNGEKHISTLQMLMTRTSDCPRTVLRYK